MNKYGQLLMTIEKSRKPIQCTDDYGNLIILWEVYHDYEGNDDDDGTMVVVVVMMMMMMVMMLGFFCPVQN